MDPYRREWNDGHQTLRAALEKPERRDEAVSLFLRLHAMLHTASLSNLGLHSFEGEVWAGLGDAAARAIPPGFEHSIAWNLWHLARIEDMTMNRLVAGGPQIFYAAGWAAGLKASALDTGNAMDAAEIAALSREVDLAELRAYRAAVGVRTRDVVSTLDGKDFRRKVDPARLELIAAEGGVLPQARWLLEYWGGLTVAGLLLMPPTRHCLVHLNECLRIRRKIFGKGMYDV
jgi:hypothetical protein